MKSLRKIVFWGHLALGLAAGSIVLSMSVTGVVLAFERQALRWAELEQRTVLAREARRLSPRELLACVARTRPGARPTGLTQDSEPGAAALVQLGREGILYVDPYTGAVLGEGSKRLRGFFRGVADWHRRLGSGELGRGVTRICNLAFLALVPTGLFLWWPRRWSRPALVPRLLPRRGLPGRVRDFNWHNSIGFWCAPALLALAATGAVLSFPPPSAVRGGAERQEPAPAPPSLDRLWALAEARAPGALSISLRLPRASEEPVSFSLEEGRSWNRFARSRLELDAATGEPRKWEPYEEQSLAQRLRSWARWSHTGEAFGLVGQSIACLASLGAVVLVWTGFSLAWRRFRGPVPAVSAERARVASDQEGCDDVSDGPFRTSRRTAQGGRG